MSEFKQGEMVRVRGGIDDEWVEKVFVVKHYGRYYCEKYLKDGLLSWAFAEAIPKKKTITIEKWLVRISGDILRCTVLDISMDDNVREIYGDDLVKLLDTYEVEIDE